MDANERRRLLRKRAVRRQLGLVVAVVFVIGLSIYFVSCVTSARADAKEEKAKKEAQIAKEEAKEAAVKVRQKEHEKEAKEREALMKKLQTETEKMVSGFAGDWSVYIQEMDYGNEIVLNNEPMYPASLVKLFVMAATYENLDEVMETQTEYYGSAKKAWSETKKLLEEMIEVSDNEAYNELIKVQSSD
ncbi:MAG: serine hydrolase, partial [Blautia sp.]|nr:serine hydrolase [Blautia sp.]